VTIAKVTTLAVFPASYRMESTMNTETTFNFTITGRSLASRYAEVDVTSVYGAAGREPMTRAEITEMIERVNDDGPIVWDEDDDTHGVFASVDPDDDEVRAYAITLEDIIMEPTKFNFTITGPSRSFGSWHDDVDVTEDFWGAFAPEPMTLAEITDLVGLTPENSPVVWEDSPYGGQFGTFTSPVDPDEADGTYSITLDEASA
jgi:hypothetical protein